MHSTHLLKFSQLHSKEGLICCRSQNSFTVMRGPGHYKEKYSSSQLYPQAKAFSTPWVIYLDNQSTSQGQSTQAKLNLANQLVLNPSHLWQKSALGY